MEYTYEGYLIDLYITICLWPLDIHRHIQQAYDWSYYTRLLKINVGVTLLASPTFILVQSMLMAGGAYKVICCYVEGIKHPCFAGAHLISILTTL